jgi:hypothetical protein
MRKIAAVLLFAALLAPVAARAAGPDGEESFIKRVAAYLRLRGDGPATPTAGTAPASGGRRSLFGPPPPSCTCIIPGNITVGGYVADDGSCQPLTRPGHGEQYQLP